MTLPRVSPYLVNNRITCSALPDILMYIICIFSHFTLEPYSMYSNESGIKHILIDYHICCIMSDGKCILLPVQPFTSFVCNEIMHHSMGKAYFVCIVLQSRHIPGDNKMSLGLPTPSKFAQTGYGPSEIFGIVVPKYEPPWRRILWSELHSFYCKYEQAVNNVTKTYH